MNGESVAEYLRRAAEAREQADRAYNPEDRLRWLRIASAWETLAGYGQACAQNDNAILLRPSRQGHSNSN